MVASKRPSRVRELVIPDWPVAILARILVVCPQFPAAAHRAMEWDTQLQLKKKKHSCVQSSARIEESYHPCARWL